MQPRRTRGISFRRHAVTGALLAAVMIVAVVQLNAPVTAVVIDGNSMQPGIMAGDLVITRRAVRYETGEIVSYRQPDQRGLILHRIVAWEDGRLVLQGDNNAHRDSYHPLPSEVLGRLLIRIPGGGGFVRWLRVNQSMLGITVAGASIALLATRRRRRARGRDQPSEVRRPETRRGPPSPGPTGNMLAGSFALVAAFSGVVLIASLIAGVRRDVPVSNVYAHVGTFSYRAEGGAGVYDTPFAETGDPVFRKLAGSVDVRFDYRLDTTLFATVAGTYSLSAQLSHPNGWTRTLELVPAAPFDGPEFTAEGVFDFSRAQALIDRMEEQAGMGNEVYILTFMADVAAAGMVGGQAFEERFTPLVEFRLDSWRLQLLSGGGADAVPLSSEQRGEVISVRVEDRAVAAFGLSLRVGQAQAGAAAALGASGIGLAMLGALALVSRRGGEAATIKARYGNLMVPAQLTQLPRDAALIEVSAIKHLVEMARRDGVMILHEEDGDGDCFMVVGRDAIHFYRTTHAEPDAASPARAEAPPNLVLMPGPGTDSAPPVQTDGRDLRRAG